MDSCSGKRGRRLVAYLTLAIMLLASTSGRVADGAGTPQTADYWGLANAITEKTTVTLDGTPYVIATLSQVVGPPALVANFANVRTIFLDAQGRPIGNERVAQRLGVIYQARRFATGSIGSPSALRANIDLMHQRLRQHEKITAGFVIIDVLGKASAFTIRAYLTGGVSLYTDLMFESGDAMMTVMKSMSNGSGQAAMDFVDAEKAFRRAAALAEKPITDYQTAVEYLMALAEGHINFGPAMDLLDKADKLDQSTSEMVLDELADIATDLALKQSGKFLKMEKASTAFEKLLDVADTIKDTAWHKEYQRRRDQEWRIYYLAYFPASDEYREPIWVTYTLLLALEGSIHWPKPAAPTVTGKAVTQGASPGILLEWKADPEAYYWEVWRNDRLLVTTSSPAPRYFDSAVKPGQTYSYKVRGRTSTRYGDFSRPVTVRADKPNPAPASPQGVRVVVNNRDVYMDVPAVLENGRTLVPLRAIGEALGADVLWDEPTQTVTLVLGGKLVRLTLTKAEATVDGDPILLDVPAQVKDGRTMVPLRFISERLGATIAWDGATNTASITSTVAEPPPIPEHTVQGRAIGAGAETGYLVDAGGAAWAWGSNRFRQLGTGAPAHQISPAPIPGLSGVVSVAAGYSAGYAVTHDGSVWSWGSNESLNLGDGSDTPRSYPEMIPGFTGVRSVVAYMNTVYALKTDGTVWAWGSGSSGALGIGTCCSHKSRPVQVRGLTSITAIAAGYNSGYALKDDGTVWAWGGNSRGQLGTGDTNRRTEPVQVPGLTDVTAIGAAHSTGIAVLRDGTVWAWGSNDRGQLGKPGGGNSLTPVQVAGLSGVKAVAAAHSHLLALTGDGSVWVWADEGRPGSPGPVQVPGRSDLVAIAPGVMGLALAADGTVWKVSSSGLYTAVSIFPAPDIPPAVAIAGNDNWSLLVAGDGSAWAWGLDLDGQLGRGTVVYSDTPVPVEGLADLLAMTGSLYVGYALTAGGTVWQWGWTGGWDPSSFGPADWAAPQPLQVPDLPPVQAVAAGGGPPAGTALAITRDGAVYGWSGFSRPRLVPAVSGATAAAVGWDANYVLQSDGTVWAWGSNESGQLGDGTTAARESPVQVSDLTEVTGVAAGMGFAYALKRNGTVWAWGKGTSGELGNGSLEISYRPVQVSGLIDVVAIAAGWNGGYALKRDGTVWAWGPNWWGRLGSDNAQDGDVPVKVNGLPAIRALAAGSDFVLALGNDGTLWAWGRNSLGQYGDGSTTSPGGPVRVRLP